MRTLFSADNISPPSAPHSMSLQKFDSCSQATYYPSGKKTSQMKGLDSISHTGAFELPSESPKVFNNKSESWSLPRLVNQNLEMWPRNLHCITPRRITLSRVRGRNGQILILSESLCLLLCPPLLISFYSICRLIFLCLLISGRC